MILSLKTAHVGRSGRGHMALPNPCKGSMIADASNWATGAGTFYEKANLFGAALLAGHDITYSGGLLTSHLSARLWSRKDAVTRDIVAYIPRLPIRWLESRETAP